MRKIRRRKNSVRSIIILSMLCFVTMGIGYSYLQETLNVHVQVTKKDQRIDITEDVVTSGSGLYQDSYEYGRYVYRGNEPNNYIQFNDELWRIIAKETDGTYKIVHNSLSEERVYDETGYRATTNNTYCDKPQYGCNIFGKVNGIFTSANKSGTITQDSSLASYLNSTYYTKLSSTAQNLIQVHNFNIGNVIHMPKADNDSIAKNIEDEKAYQWEGKVGLINVTDYLRATINNECKSASYDNSTNDACTSYLVEDLDVNQHYWTMNGYSGETSASSNAVWYVSHFSSGFRLRNIVANSASRYVRPVVYLKADIQFIDGKGTESDPYIITL